MVGFIEDQINECATLRITGIAKITCGFFLRIINIETATYLHSTPCKNCPFGFSVDA